MPHIGLSAHLLSASADYRSAGIHTYIHHLLRALPLAAPADWSFTAFVPRGLDTRYHTEAIYPGFWLKGARFDTRAAWRRILWEQLAQPWQLGGLDLLHATAFVRPVASRIPSVVTVYDLSFLHYPQTLPASRRAYLRAFTHHSVRRARRVLVISGSTGRDLVQHMDVASEKIDVTPLGYDRQRFRPLRSERVERFRNEQGLPARFWFYLGTLEPRKNLVTLIEAYAQLHPDDRLPLLLGGGLGWDYAPVFDAIARHGLGQEIRHLGFIPSEDLPLWYNAAEAFLYPSLYEGFGLPVLEAMACGTPVVTSNASSLPEVAGDAALLVPATELDAWVAALSTALEAPWRQAAASAGVARAALFSWAAMADRTLASYVSALGS
jgi:glycosyltransferase involved in cell wall biosynthesis